MSDKRKGLRHLFTLGFFGATLLFIGGFFILCFYFFLKFMGVMDSIDPQPLDSASTVYKIQAKELNDSLAAHKKDSLHIKHLVDSIAAIDPFPKEYHDSLFTYEMNYDSTKDGNGKWEHYIKSVKIVRIADHKKIQTVIPKEPFPINGYIPPFQMEDMNFDGCGDFRILSFVMIRGQQFYDFWLYNPKKNLFEENAQLEETWDVDFDHKEKTVTSNERDAGPFDVVNKTFIWENGKMILQNKEESIADVYGGDGGEINMTQRINGKLIKRSRHYKNLPITPEGSVIFEWDSLK